MIRASIFFTACTLLLLPLAAEAKQRNYDYSAKSHTAEDSFAAWLDEFRADAREQGISDDTLDAALSGIEPDDRVVTLDRKQPESKLSPEEYLKRTVPASRVNRAREEYDDNRKLLNEIGRRYGVQPRYILALWAMESNFGDRMGDFSVVESLATLAYDGRRSAYFRKELLNALRIIDNGHIGANDMLGSWAGAMGQCQFMPSSYLKYAVDYDRDGRADIWYTQADVFASIANYLSSEGWDGRSEVGTAGARTNNFNVVMKWNRSINFATAVGTLADRIGEAE